MKNRNSGLSPAAILAAARGDADNFLTAATPGGIEAQERAGQAMTNMQQTLPKEMHNCTRADLEGLGFVFGDDQDDLFVHCRFPTGWRKQSTDHAMHSDLIDDKGRTRGSIFYKAAFYDRRADLMLSRRFSIEKFRDCNESGEDAPRGSHWKCVVTDSGKQIHLLGVYPAHDFDECRKLEGEARAWLETNYPQWNSVSAYWD